ncbi:MAG: SDR family NAD(P)-dependent oxidoreductase [Parvularculaceae bacterium]
MSHPQTKPQHGRIALITGASRGIGRAAALALANAGAHIVALARTSGALEELDDEIREAGGAATLAVTDIADGDAIDRLGAALYDRWGRIDVLIAGAGELGELGPLPHMSPKSFDRVFAVNVTANFRLIRSLDPLLKQSEAGRAVFLTSNVTTDFRAYWGGYAASKAALEALALTYAHECENTSVCANLLDPGATRTRMRAQALPGEDPQTVKPPEALAPLILEMADPEYRQNGQRIVYSDRVAKRSA